MPLYQNKFQIQSARHKNWDYTNDGYYFVTICTKYMQKFFGEVVDGEMKLSEIGKIANKYWQEIPKHFPFVKLDEFVVMPNHVHGIIEIKNGTVETQNFASLRSGNKFGPQSKNLGSIVRGFKVGVKKYATINKIDFQWQPRFYDRIICDEQALGKIREYIQRNPKFWDEDKNKVENIFY